MATKDITDKSTNKPVKAAKSEYQVRSTGELYRTVWKQLKANPQPLFIYIAVYVFFTFVSAAAQNNFFPDPKDHQRTEDLVNLLFLSALPLYGLALADKKKLAGNDFTAIKPNIFTYLIGVTILFAAVSFLSIALLIIPAFWVIAWYTLSSYPAVDKAMPPIAALRESKRISKDNKGKVWIVNLSVILASIPILICDAIPGTGIYLSSIVSAVITVLIMGVYAALYRDLQKKATSIA